MGNKKGIKKKRYAWNPKNEFFYNLMASKPGILAINWVFQGILGMDRTERGFKIGLDLALTLLFVAAFGWRWDRFDILIASFVLAHTINWAFNGHLFAMGCFVGFSDMSPDRMWRYVALIQRRVADKSFLIGVAIFGAMTRGKPIHRASDLDIRFIREKGFFNGVLAAIFGMMERSRAAFNRFPLDLYVYDGVGSLDRLRDDEEPIILYDPKNILAKRYSERGYRNL